ncbi:hypothetical protein [Actinomadura rifamycini]|uniref:hypothetical protein n=1 Tax=Actinomadura rifamycini TaxID=31962 RepID=UPI00047CCB61|nr:hypothetical protein [Actinomadura rifamycini]
MGYPGDQGNPGGRTPRPPQSPYGPGDDRPFDGPPGPYDQGGGLPPPGVPDGPAFGREREFGPGPGRYDDRYDDGPYDDRFDDDRFDDERPRRRRPLVIGAIVGAGIVLVGGGVALSSTLGGDSGAPAAADRPAPATTPPTPTPSVTLAPVKLRDRTTDPAPLTLKEVFGNGEFEVNDHKYARTAWHSEKKCTGIVGGAKLDTAVAKGGCTQALRATYAISGGALIGTLGVLNLKSEAHAEAAEKAATADDAYLLALPGKGITKTNGKGVALGTARARGHYLVMTWVQRPNGKTISKRHHGTVRVFGDEIYRGSNLALALHYRETEGKPLQK